MKNIDTTVAAVVYAQLRKVVLTAVLFTALLGLVPPASADLLTYSLNNVTFADGGKATGTITLDYFPDVPVWGSRFALIGFNVTVTDPAFVVQPLVFTSGSAGVGSVLFAAFYPFPGYIQMYQGGFTADSATLYLNIPSGDFLTGSAPPTSPIQLVPRGDVFVTFAPVTAPAELVWEGPNPPFFVVQGLGGSLVQQAPVPNPATLLLLGPGLVGLAGIRRRLGK